MPDLKELLDRLQAPAPADGDWDAVLRDAGTEGRSSSRLLRSALALGAAVTALVGLALFQPWQSDSGSVLERALAAVDGGPVMHVTLRGDWGGTLVELDSGGREPVHGERELWYDPGRGLLHERSLLGGTVVGEYMHEPRDPPIEYVALGRDYRSSLESGSARIIEEGSVDGIPVVWIKIRSEMLPDVADGKDHEWAQQVAVSLETFKPVALRETRDGKPGPGTEQRVLELKMLPAGEGDFAVTGDAQSNITPYQEGARRISLERAGETLGRRPLWLGLQHRGLPLREASRTWTSAGRQEQTLLQGRAAADAQACTRVTRHSGSRTGPACDRMRAARQSLVIRDGKVYALGPVEWGEEQVGVRLFYGELGDDASTFRRELVPRYDLDHVAVTQAGRRPFTIRGIGGKYVPREGTVFVAAGGRSGFLQQDGLYVEIEASREELLVSAARALKAMTP